MDAEQTFFLNTLSEHIRGAKTEVPSDIDIEEVKTYASEHQVEPILYYQTKLDAFRQAYYAQLIMYDHRCSIIAGVLKEMGDLPYVIMKGPLIAEYYPVPELRTMGDVDIIVHLEDREEAVRRLEKYGFELVEKLTGEWEFSYEGVLIELHTALIYKYSKATSDHMHYEYFNNLWAHLKDGQIDLNFHVLYLFLHLRKHIMETGVGFRQFMDLALVVDRAPVDWEWVRRESENLGLYPFIQTALTFNERWFGVKSPYERAEISEEFFEDATQHIFKDGVFGFNNVENENNRAINERKKSGSRFSRLNVFFEHLFWPYERMITMPEYHWLKGKKFLLPIAWGERSVIKLNEWKDLKKRYFASDEALRERYDYFSKWNIHNDKE